MNKKLFISLAPLFAVAVLAVGTAITAAATLRRATLPALPPRSAHPLASLRVLRSHPAALLPAGLATAASASIGASEHSFAAVRHGASQRTQGGGIHSTFTASGAALHVAQGTLGLSLTGVGRGQRLKRVVAVAPSGAANQILYRHGSISEFYRNGPYGLEQGFRLRQRPQAGAGPLVLALSLRGSLIPQQVGSEVLFRTHVGVTALRYGQLSALDATGRPLRAHMQIRNRTLQLRIDDSRARYPLRIDPFIQQIPKLTATGETGAGEFGVSVALSANGETALIGAPNDNTNVGAAWVATRVAGVWKVGPKLIAEAGSETGEGLFGDAVALSHDGNTALIAGPGDESFAGAVWVFKLEGTWTQKQKLTTATAKKENGINVEFGSSVALGGDTTSGDTTALIGAGNDSALVGAAWVFRLEGGKYIEKQKLTASALPEPEIGRAEFGDSVALSANGNTALIGAEHDGAELEGAAWVFKLESSPWKYGQSKKLTGTEEIGNNFKKSQFGRSVALSADGTVALIGGVVDGSTPFTGAAWAFTLESGKYKEQKLIAETGTETGGGEFGFGVALSEDGNTALIGGQSDSSKAGAAWVFTRPRGTPTWAQKQKLTGGGEESENGFFGHSPVLSRAGHIALIGGPGDNINVGAVWAFATEPPHWYRNNVKVGATKVQTTSWGTITLNAGIGPEGPKGEKGTEPFTVTCKQADGGNIWNPVSGGAGLDETVAVDLYECTSEQCPFTTSVTASGLPWLSELIEEPGNVLRDKTTGISLTVKCLKGAEEVFSYAFQGELTPKIRKGTSAAHPAADEFGEVGSGEGSGELLRETAVGAIAAGGEDKFDGFEEQELINVKNP